MDWELSIQKTISTPLYIGGTSPSFVQTWSSHTPSEKLIEAPSPSTSKVVEFDQPSGEEVVPSPLIDTRKVKVVIPFPLILTEPLPELLVPVEFICPEIGRAHV